MVVVSLQSLRSEAGQDDVAELYDAHARRLMQIVRRRVRAPEAVIEDACQFAWDRLVLHRHRVRTETALGWLATTAVREAFKLLRNEGRDLSLDELAHGAGEPALAARTPAPDELVVQRARLDTIASLSERQQRLVWAQGFGLSYTEMAEHTGDSPRTVERQLLRAKRALRCA